MAIVIERIRCTNDKLGDVMLFGIYGGAICSHFMATNFTQDGNTVWTKVDAVSVKVVDGNQIYYTTKYVVAEK